MKAQAHWQMAEQGFRIGQGLLARMRPTGSPQPSTSPLVTRLIRASAT
jgi:hypothetical protein